MGASDSSLSVTTRYFMQSHWHTLPTELVVLHTIEEIPIVILHRSANYLDLIEEETFGRAFRRGQETRAEQRRI